MNTPVQMVQEWLTAIGEKYDPALRERLLWEEVRELQAAMDDYYAIHDAVGRLDEPSWSGDMKARKALIAIARELIDVAIVALGNALISGAEPDTVRWYLGPMLLSGGGARHRVEAHLYELFEQPYYPEPIRYAAAYYGFGDKLEACFAEVHRANMAKLPDCVECEHVGQWEESDKWTGEAFAVYCDRCEGNGRIITKDATGRILKPVGWKEPDLAPILFGGGE